MERVPGGGNPRSELLRLPECSPPSWAGEYTQLSGPSRAGLHTGLVVRGLVSSALVSLAEFIGSLAGPVKLEGPLVVYRIHGGRAMENVVLSEVAAVVKDKSLEISADTELIGDGRVLDSLGLVELCLRLEDRASELGFEFDWTSEVAMSQSKGMFRTVGSLQAEFSRQQDEPV